MLRKHDARSEQIGEAAWHLAMDILHPNNIRRYWLHLIQEYAKLQASKHLVCCIPCTIAGQSICSDAHIWAWHSGSLGCVLLCPWLCLAQAMLARCLSILFRVALLLQTFQPTLHPDSLTLGQSLTHPSFVNLEGRTCAVCGHNPPAGSRFELSLQQQMPDNAHMASDAAAAEQDAIAAAQQAAAQAATEAAVSSEDPNAAAAAAAEQEAIASAQQAAAQAAAKAAVSSEDPNAAAAAAVQQAAGAQQAAEAAGQDPMAAEAAQQAAAGTVAAAALEAQHAAPSEQLPQEVADAGNTGSIQARNNEEQSGAGTAQQATPQTLERKRRTRNHHLVHPGGHGDTPKI